MVVNNTTMGFHPIVTFTMFAIANAQLSTFCLAGTPMDPTKLLPMHIRKTFLGSIDISANQKVLNWLLSVVGSGDASALDE